MQKNDQILVLHAAGKCIKLALYLLVFSRKKSVHRFLMFFTMLLGQSVRAMKIVQATL